MAGENRTGRLQKSSATRSPSGHRRGGHAHAEPGRRLGPVRAGSHVRRVPAARQPAPDRRACLPTPRRRNISTPGASATGSRLPAGFFARRAVRQPPAVRQRPMQWVTHEVWLPDGRELAFVDWSHVVRAVYPATGSVRTLAGVQRLARGPEPRRQVDGGRHRSPQRRPAALPGARRAGSPHRLRIGRLDRGEPLLHRVRRDVRCENASCEKRVRPSFCLRPRGERGSADGTQRSQDDSDRHCGRGAGAAGVHGACLPVMRASTREEMRRISSTSRSSSRLFSIHSR